MSYYYNRMGNHSSYNLSPYNYECDLQFNDSEDGSTINVKIFSTPKTFLTVAIPMATLKSQ